MSDERTERDLCEWVAEAYDAGVVNVANYRESAAFLRGFYTAMDVAGRIDSAGTEAMERAINTLHAGASFVAVCRNFKATVKI